MVLLAVCPEHRVLGLVPQLLQVLQPSSVGVLACLPLVVSHHIPTLTFFTHYLVGDIVPPAITSFTALAGEAIITPTLTSCPGVRLLQNLFLSYLLSSLVLQT